MSKKKKKKKKQSAKSCSPIGKALSFRDEKEKYVTSYQCPICNNRGVTRILNALGDPIQNQPVECKSCLSFYYISLTPRGLFCHKRKLEEMENEKKAVSKGPGAGLPGAGSSKEDPRELVDL